MRRSSRRDDVPRAPGRAKVGRMTERVIRRLTILKDDADKEPVPQRKFFHIGQPDVLEDLGECVPMISWVDDNLSRFVIADGPSSTWGRGTSRLYALPNRAVKVEDGLFVATGPGEDRSVPHPNKKGQIHFVHSGARASRFGTKGLVKIFTCIVSRGVQFKNLMEKKR